MPHMKYPETLATMTIDGAQIDEMWVYPDCIIVYGGMGEYLKLTGADDAAMRELLGTGVPGWALDYPGFEATLAMIYDSDPEVRREGEELLRPRVAVEDHSRELLAALQNADAEELRELRLSLLKLLAECTAFLSSEGLLEYLSAQNEAFQRAAAERLGWLFPPELAKSLGVQTYEEWLAEEIELRKHEEDDIPF